MIKSTASVHKSTNSRHTLVVFQCVLRNIFAVMHAVPGDFSDGAVDILDRARDIFSARGYAEHSTTGGQPTILLFCRAGVKDKAVGPVVQLIESANFFSLIV